MKISVNGELRELPPGSTVGEIIDGLGKGRRGMVAAVDEEIVPASRWDQTVLHENHRVEVLTAAQGG